MEVSSHESVKHDVKYFRNMYETESRRIIEVCDVWEKKLNEAADIPEDVEGQIRSVIGQGRIMVAEKGRFRQFAGLVDNCEFGLGEVETKV